MCAAAFAGCFSWFIVYPLDVVKSKVQQDAGGMKFSGCYDCLIKTFKEGGVFALYRGISFTLIRAAPVAATILPLYEKIKFTIESSEI